MWEKEIDRRQTSTKSHANKKEGSTDKHQLRLPKNK
jgi:hypothetical protein